MPINGLTNPSPDFLLIGRLKKGDKDKNGVPFDLDYWRAIFKPGKDQGRIEARFREVYGDEPKDINIRLAFNTVIENWDANHECYRNGVLVAKAATTEERGAYWIYYRDPETTQVLVRNNMPVGDDGIAFIQKPIDITKPVYYTKKKNEPVFFEPTGRLRIVIPEIAQLDPPVVGFFEVILKSTKDIRQVSAELKGISRGAASLNAPLSGVPMRLSRMEEQITKNINNNLTRGPSWMVHIALTGEWAGRILPYLEHMALPEIVDGEIEEIPQLESGEFVQDTESDSAKINNSKAVPRPNQTRPFSHETLKDEFDEKVKHYTNLKTPVYEKGAQVVAKALKVVFPDDTDRYAFTGWLTGNTSGSTKGLKTYEVLAFADLMGIDVSGKQGFNQLPSDVFTQEAKVGLEFANALHGQEEFPF